MERWKIILKILIATMIILYCSNAFAYLNSDLNQAAMYADDSARNARKAFFSDDIDDANYYARRSKNDAFDCQNCLNRASWDVSNSHNSNAIKILNMAMLSIQEAEAFARKAQYASNLDEAQFYADKARKAANQADSFIRQLM